MRNSKTLILVFLCVLFSSALVANDVLYVKPETVRGVKKAALLLNGTWQFKRTAESRQTTIQVPGEAVMQGYAVELDKPFFYKTAVNIPADYKGKKIILRFDGVYSYARLSVNGTFVREHRGGFTRWDTDITAYVKPGKKNEIELEVTDEKEEISYASGYAHHPIGCILRDVTLFAVAQTNLCDFYVETHLDAAYKDAVLKIGYTATVPSGATIEYQLADPSGVAVVLAQNSFALSAAGECVNEMAVANPLKWDAEHPNLYTLTAVVKENGVEASRFSKKIGFREIKVDGDVVRVNGKPVKWRGANRHDIHPTLGRTTTPEIDSLDALLFKRSNMNYIRTSHYPPSECFVDYCDRYGIYVECEAAVCFVGTWRQHNFHPGYSQNDPAHKEQYLSQFAEMVKTFRAHPSVALWSIGNESKHGSNFQQCREWLNKNDTTRPAIFGYPGTQTEGGKVYDVLSMHYPSYSGFCSEYGIVSSGFQVAGYPVLFDEWAHPACYTYATLQDDPGIREFWGQSLDKMWSTLFAAKGGFGGGIWGFVDETFSPPTLKEGKAYWLDYFKRDKPEDISGQCMGYGEWGIVDIWRRPKPEFWATKKAYSPVKLLETKVSAFISGERIIIPVHNRFDHTNLNEIKITYTYNGVEKAFSVLSIEPHQRGVLIIPAHEWQPGDVVTVKSYTREGELIDADNILIGSKKVAYPQASRGGKLTIDDADNKLTVRGEGFEIPFCKESGLICNATVNGRVFIEKGPFLNMDINLNHLSGAEARERAEQFLVSDADWKKRSLTYGIETGNVHVMLSGSYGNVSVDMQIVIYPQGRIEVDYLTEGQPNGYLRETGLKFYLPETIDHLKWERDGYWSYYPEGEFAGNSGQTPFYSKPVAYAQKPEQEWTADAYNYYYWGDAGANCKNPLTNSAKGMKENVRYYTLSSGANDGLSFSVVSEDASVACRTNKRADEQLVMYVNNRWDYPEIAWGNYSKILQSVPCYGKISVVF